MKFFKNKIKCSRWIHSTIASVTWKDEYLTLPIKASRIDQLHLGHKIYIPLSDEHFCPFSTIQEYVLYVPDYTEVRAQCLFTFNDGSPRTRHSCLKYSRNIYRSFSTRLVTFQSISVQYRGRYFHSSFSFGSKHTKQTSWADQEQGLQQI